MKTKDFIKKVYVYESAFGSSLPVLERLDMAYEVIDDDLSITGDKSVLLISSKKGAFVKKCPCSNDSVSCGYYNINLVEGCFFDCSYCILQLYLKDRPITLYSNFDDVIKELDDILPKKKFIRIGPGELADCLCLDDITGYSKQLINYFKDKKNTILEIKTKDSDISGLLGLEHGGRSVISFSLNTEKVCNKEENGASSLTERIDAAKEAVLSGYKVGFHFDPVVIYEGYLEEYEQTLEMVSHSIDKEKIAWISIGLLRFPAQLQPIIRERHGDNFILTGELIKSDASKMRYFIGMRKNTYDAMLKMFKKYLRGVNYYICMDTAYLWDKMLDRNKSLKSLNCGFY